MNCGRTPGHEVSHGPTSGGQGGEQAESDGRSVLSVPSNDGVERHQGGGPLQAPFETPQDRKGTAIKLDVRAAALATGGISTLFYALCTAFFALVPEPAAVYVTAGVLHIDSTGLNRQMTSGTVVVGLLVWGLGTAVAAGAMAWLYNRLARTEAETSQSAHREEAAGTGRTR